MTNQDLVLKVPTLKRHDHQEYIQFKLEPPPKIRMEEHPRVKIS